MRARLGGLCRPKGLGQCFEPSGVAEGADVGHRVGDEGHRAGDEVNGRRAGVAAILHEEGGANEREEKQREHGKDVASSRVGVVG